MTAFPIAHGLRPSLLMYVGASHVMNSMFVPAAQTADRRPELMFINGLRRAQRSSMQRLRQPAILLARVAHCDRIVTDTTRPCDRARVCSN